MYTLDMTAINKLASNWDTMTRKTIDVNPRVFDALTYKNVPALPESVRVTLRTSDGKTYYMTAGGYAADMSRRRKLASMDFRLTAREKQWIEELELPLSHDDIRRAHRMQF